MNETERQIVAWLQKRGLSWRTRGDYANAYDLIADAIERGEHRESDDA